MYIGHIELNEAYIQVNGVCLLVLSAGNTDGQLVVCVHGFPDTPHTFMHQLQPLIDEGYYVVIPFMRGYAPSQTGPDVDYFPQRLSEDILALIDHFSDNPAIILGHDWGAIAAYGAAQLAPDKIDKMITAAVPPFKVFSTAGGDLKQSWRSRYAVLFQCGPLANWSMRKNNCSGLDWLWGYWSPTWHYSPEDIQPLKDCLSQGGAMEAATGYYRAMVRGSIADTRFAKLLMEPISVPTIVFSGTDDGCISPVFFDDLSESFSDEWQSISIQDAGHFMHREKPEPFNTAMLTFLRSSL